MLQVVDEIGALPRKSTVRFGFTTEMAVGGGARVDRSIELKMASNAARRQVDELLKRIGQALLVDLACAVCLDVHRQRMRHADRIRKLDGAPIRQSGCDRVLRQIARCIGSGTVHLAWIFAGKSAAAVRCGAAVGIDDDLAPGQSGVAVGSADNEASRRD